MRKFARRITVIVITLLIIIIQYSCAREGRQTGLYPPQSLKFLVEEEQHTIDCYQQSPSANSYSQNVFTCPSPVEECYKYICVGNGRCNHNIFLYKLLFCVVYFIQRYIYCYTFFFLFVSWHWVDQPNLDYVIQNFVKISKSAGNSKSKEKNQNQKVEIS